MARAYMASGSIAAARNVLEALIDLDPDHPQLEVLQVSVALSLCTAANPLHTRFANIFGISISDTTMRPDPRCC
jgi:hypothetical protein